MYAVRKSPIEVIEIIAGDSINNYPENKFRTMNAVPGLINRHLKWHNGNPDTGILIEKTSIEKIIADQQMSDSSIDTLRKDKLKELRKNILEKIIDQDLVYQQKGSEILAAQNEEELALINIINLTD